jgi:hypothetical protein
MKSLKYNEVSRMRNNSSDSESNIEITRTCREMSLPEYQVRLVSFGEEVC